MMLLIGPPPNASVQTRAIATSVSFWGERNDALPFGKQALLRLGGVEKDAQGKGGDDRNAFDESKIVIPLGITPQTLKNYTLYDMLGLAGDIGGSANAEAIKKAYHKAVLVYHPDKVQHMTAAGKEDRSVFLKVQEAFNVLSNETKRRAYDSQMPFDESTPTEEKVIKALAKGPHKFFKLYDPVFKRNARFAVKKPVPEIGDVDSPMNDVYRFYEYWINFESWRDFTGVGAEHKVDDTMSRDERRYYAKENEAHEKKLKKKEMTRLINMVMLAEKFDPRISADKEKKKAAKEADKEAKEASTKQRAEIDAASKAWAQQLEDEAKDAVPKTKEEKEKIKKKASTARNSFKKLLRATATAGASVHPEYGVITDKQVEMLCANCELEELTLMISALGGEAAVKDTSLLRMEGSDDVIAMIQQTEGKADEAKEDERIEKDAKRRASLEAASSPRKKQQGTPGKGGEMVVPDRDWTSDELFHLEKSMKRYPATLANRWQLITNYVNDKILPADGVPPAVMSVSVDEMLRAAYTHLK